MSPSPEMVVSQLAYRPGTVWLDSGDGLDGWSIVAWDPTEVHTAAVDWPVAGRCLGRPRAHSDAAPFVGGVLGYIGFGAGSQVEPIPSQAPTPEPPVWLGRYAGALCFRHRDRSWHPTGSSAVRRHGQALLEAACALSAPPPPPQAASATSQSQHHFEAGVRRILTWVQAGDCYQVNLTRPVWVHRPGDPWSAYRRLRRAEASHGAYLTLDGQATVLSNSPEPFVTVRGDQVESTPIKGTRPRGADPTSDARLRAELRDAAKDRAELTMIVDLVRNDLGRIAALGTVRTGPRRLTEHPNVHHARQTVSATLQPGSDLWTVLAATFPPGSITGAPKIRACERIAQLEAHPRGVYCGAIGFVSDHGPAEFSVAIRTAVFANGSARYHVGGGIVAGSTPTDEWHETVHKGEVLHQALVGGPGPT